MRETALVTGATSGIGLELARLLARDHCRLVLVARSADALQNVAGELTAAYSAEVITIPCDLSAQSGARSLWSSIQERNLDIDILVNNAGFGNFGRFADSDINTDQDEIQLNVAALTYLTRSVLPGMIARRQGRILNVASTAAFQPGPLMAVYYATKAYVLHFSEAVSAELQGTGVTVTTLCPGPVITGFQSRAGMPAMQLTRGPWVMTATKVAEIGYRAMRRGKRVVVPGFFNRLLLLGTRLSSRRMATNVVYRLQKSRERNAG